MGNTGIAIQTAGIPVTLILGNTGIAIQTARIPVTLIVSNTAIAIGRVQVDQSNGSQSNEVDSHEVLDFRYRQ